MKQLNTFPSASPSFGRLPDPRLPDPRLADAELTDRWNDDRSMAVLAHVLGMFTSFVGPFIVYLATRPDQRFAKRHAAESLNLQLTALLAWIVTFALSLAGSMLAIRWPALSLAGLLVPALFLTMLVLPALAAGAAHAGSGHRHRFVIRFVAA